MRVHTITIQLAGWTAYQSSGLPDKPSCASGLQKHFRRILPETEVEALVAMYTSENEDQLLSGRPSFVLDAIDNIDTKVKSQ